MANNNSEYRGSGRQTVFLQLLIPLVSGILAQSYLPLPSSLLLAGFCISLLILALLQIKITKHAPVMGWVNGLLIQIAFFSMGRLLIFVHRDIPVENSRGFISNQPNLLQIRILSDPVPKEKTYKSTAQVVCLLSLGRAYFENEKMLVYFSKKTDIRLIAPGRMLLIRKELQPIENTGDFDYRKFNRQKHIYAQVFLRDNEFGSITDEKEESITEDLGRFRKKLLAIIKKNIPGKSESGLLEALMVGFTGDLDPVILKSYADTGVIHIIAISGLHLILIAHILQFGLQKTGQKKSAIWGRFLILVMVIWGYSFLSGASPSVIRAAMMFSLSLLARNLKREISLFHSLAVSAFLLLCFDPGWLWDIGFQLSYAAIISLGLFARPVRDFLPLRNKMLIRFWDACSVTIAAQILTTPVSIFYFHRFPVYFLAANGIAVPLSSGILVGGILLLGCSFLSPVASRLGWAIGLSIRLLNHFISYFSRLPGAVIENLSLTGLQLFLIYSIIFCFYRFLFLKENRGMIAALINICFFLISRRIS